MIKDDSIPQIWTLSVFYSPAGGGGIEDVPDFAELFQDDPDLQARSPAFLEPENDDESTAEERFVKFDTLTNSEPHGKFSTADYYKKVLVGEGEISKRLHSLIAGFLKAQDPQDRSVFRGRLQPAFWELAANLAAKTNAHEITEKRLALRFGLLVPTMIDARQRKSLETIPLRNRSTDPVYYVDEWIRFVGSGEVAASATDETKGPRGSQARVSETLAKRRGQYDAQCTLIRSKNQELNDQLRQCAQHINLMAQREQRPELGEALEAPLSEAQKNGITEIFSSVRTIGRLNRELERAFRELERYKDDVEGLATQADMLDDQQDSAMDSSLASKEMGTVRQMAKLCVGRQGNHFPLLYKPYFRGSIHDICTRENTINILADVEYLDPGIFLRTFKQQTNRIVPNIILVPCYGEFGICWEPFDRFNRATSRGRLAIPMYPKDPRTAVIAALADLRWQVAKEKAAHYWMEEGLTGWYYQWFSEAKLKGDVRHQFIQDYILWITKESDGTQKLEREVRDILWRYTPFPQEVKDKLKNRGFVYNELCKKDRNRSLSDGY
ncbi:hypothetical protein [Spirochaeta africana]|uniref:Uncharacterized protein n=1 Tax=Spirochaeta africana (strain ATCC 700263 / DSM 8902 / Z-7692) TaxID=889378 RepID=H9UFP9_SPIAZ|nr:hypothetical protein [Spirochaeta africana]AFG36342.1 hypothetical protein Spiaf_0233 [Spirochaeta africana DSM 8902]